jgi:15-cis-phytoene desaturase
MSMRVAILGGGMGGLSCAHELARELGREHPAEITVYDAAAKLGGKARSHYVPGTGTDGRGDLPGEHGFRFYPGFYRHVIETMGEIPDEKSPNGRVSGNLTSTSEVGIAWHGRTIVGPRRPRTPMDFLRGTRALYQAGGGMLDMARYLGAHLKFMTACDARRDGEIEATPWAEFVGADEPGRYREEFRQVILACTRTMTAMDAKLGSSRTVGQASSLLLMDTAEDEVDRTMMGPTTDCWLDPWERALRRQGVRFERGQALERIELDGRRVARAWIRSRADGSLLPVEADAYILAVPLEVAHALVRRQPELADSDEGFARIRSIDLETTTQWMTGAQYFLSEDVPLAHGHFFLPDSPWSLTAISQAQFWDRGRRGMATYGDGRLRGILSIDVASCFRPDEDGVRLVDARSREEVLERVWRQFLDGVDPATRRALARARFAAHLDDEVDVGTAGVSNAARLMVHPPGSREQRPESVTGLGNLFLAADYVKTFTDLVSMEGANEAGRRAARGVLHAAGLAAEGVRVFEFPAINRFRMMRALDQRLHQAGLAHCFDWGGALVRAFKRGAEKARALPQPDGIAANGSLKPTIGRAA